MKKNLKEDTKVNLTLICINDGTVQTTRGEARSAEIRKGDIIKVTRENDYFYFGTPQIKGQFRHDPGLSGRRTNNTPVNANDVEVAISKKNSMTSDPHDFWATFKIQSNESKQFKLAEAVKEILREAKKPIENIAPGQEFELHGMKYKVASWTTNLYILLMIMINLPHF